MLLVKGSNAKNKEILKFDSVSSINRVSKMIKNASIMFDAMNYVVILLIIASALLDFVVLYNLANVNISERQREIATLKVLGFYDKEVDDYINKENIIFTIIGIILGMVFGIFIIDLIVASIEIDNLRIIRYIKPISFVYSALITITFSLIVNIIIHFILKKINIIDSPGLNDIDNTHSTVTEKFVNEADVVVCLTEDDKLNLMLALLARHLSNNRTKTVVRVARNEYVELMEKVGVDIVLSARLLSASEVLAFARRGGVVSVSLLEGARAEAVEVIVQPGAPVAGKKLMDVKLPRECLVCAYVRGNEANIPNGNTVLQPGDRTILFIQTKFSQKVIKYFKGKE